MNIVETKHSNGFNKNKEHFQHSAHSTPGSSAAKDKTLEKREEEYAKARARIFGPEVESANNNLTAEQFNSPSAPEIVVSSVAVEPSRRTEEPKSKVSPKSAEYRGTENEMWNNLWNPGVSISPITTDSYSVEGSADSTTFFSNYANYSPVWGDTNLYSNYPPLPPSVQPLPTTAINYPSLPRQKVPLQQVFHFF